MSIFGKVKSMFQGMESSEISLSSPETMKLTDVDFPKTIDGAEFDKNSLKGKVVLVVNTASQCGLTSNQYPKLAQLDDKYRASGLTILGFPSGDFNDQEYSDVCQIKKKAEQLKFQLFETVHVNGKEAAPIFQWCRANCDKFGYDPKTGKAGNVGWNFGKFLIDAEGKVAAYFGPRDDPMDMTTKIDSLLPK